MIFLSFLNIVIILCTKMAYVTNYLWHVTWLINISLYLVVEQSSGLVTTTRSPQVWRSSSHPLAYTFPLEPHTAWQRKPTILDFYYNDYDWDGNIKNRQCFFHGGRCVGLAIGQTSDLKKSNQFFLKVYSIASSLYLSLSHTYNLIYSFINFITFLRRYSRHSI